MGRGIAQVGGKKAVTSSAEPWDADNDGLMEGAII